MARHFSGEAGQGRSRRGLVVGVVALLAVCVAVGAYLVLSGGAQGNVPTEAPNEREPTVSEPAAEPTADLPFSVEGASLDASLVEASEAAQTAELAGEWTFGGDYALIGSFPIDAQTVFGSATDSPDDVTSYRAALIDPDGATYLEDAQTEEPFFEPQDGTGSGERIVWRSSEISFLPASGLDN